MDWLEVVVFRSVEMENMCRMEFVLLVLGGAVCAKIMETVWSVKKGSCWSEISARNVVLNALLVGIAWMIV